MALKRIQENIRGLRVHYEASMGSQGRFRVSQRASGRFQGAFKEFQWDFRVREKIFWGIQIV